MGHPLKPVQEEAQVPGDRTTGFEGRAPLLHRSDVGAACPITRSVSDVGAACPIARSVMTSAQAGITWGVPVSTLEVVVRGAWAGAKSSAPASAPKFGRRGGGKPAGVLGESAEGEKADASGRVACSCAGRVSQE